jgi:hypothetical protein
MWDWCESRKDNLSRSQWLAKSRGQSARSRSGLCLLDVLRRICRILYPVTLGIQLVWYCWQNCSWCNTQVSVLLNLPHSLVHPARRQLRKSGLRPRSIQMTRSQEHIAPGGKYSSPRIASLQKRRCLLSPSPQGIGVAILLPFSRGQESASEMVEAFSIVGAQVSRWWRMDDVPRHWIIWIQECNSSVWWAGDRINTLRPLWPRRPGIIKAWSKGFLTSTYSCL